MDQEAQLARLLELAESAGITVRPAPAGGEFAGGHPGGALVRLRDREILFLDGSAGVADRIAAVARALRGRPAMEETFIPPAIRRLIEPDG